MHKSRLAIVGAGVSGLAAAWALRGTAIEVVVYDKSRGVAGRAASRTRHGARFDYGANYFKLDDPQLRTLVEHTLPSTDLVSIDGEVWTFDEAGKIMPGDPLHNRQIKWSYRNGISTLAKLLAEAAGVAPNLSTSIATVEHAGAGWRLCYTEQDTPETGLFDAVLLTPPAPQTRALLANSGLSTDTAEHIDRGLAKATYHKQWCFALGFEQALPSRPPAFALINSDRQHDIAWLSFENDKPGRDLGGSTVVMVQMSPRWSAAHFEESADTLLPLVKEAVAALLGLPETVLSWHDSQRWRYAHPSQRADVAALTKAENSGIYFAGDALVGKGRIGESMQSGLDVAQRIAARWG